MSDKANSKEEMPDSMTFEQAMSRLNEIAEKLEKADPALDEAVSLYREGIELTDYCRKKLEQAKLRIRYDRSCEGSPNEPQEDN